MKKYIIDSETLDLLRSTTEIAIKYVETGNYQ